LGLSPGATADAIKTRSIGPAPALRVFRMRLTV